MCPTPPSAAPPLSPVEEFLETCKAPAAEQLAVLKRLLHLHRATQPLRRAGVDVPGELGDEEALALLRRLPLSTYDDYAPLIEAAVAAGHAWRPDHPAAQQRWDDACAAVSGAAPVYAFWCSSGTTGASKRLPASMAAVHSNMKARGGGRGAAPLPVLPDHDARPLFPCPRRPLLPTPSLPDPLAPPGAGVRRRARVRDRRLPCRQHHRQGAAVWLCSRGGGAAPVGAAGVQPRRSGACVACLSPAEEPAGGWLPLMRPAARNP